MPTKVLLQAGTATISDAIEDLGRQPLVLDTGLIPLDRSSTVKFAGPAYTITGSAIPWTGSGDTSKLTAIDQMPSGVVAVWAGNDITGVCCFGDILATAMKARGCNGIVVDGGIRDVAYLINLGIPIVSRYRSPASSKGRWSVTGWQIPVQVSGCLVDTITINPGDFIVTDEDGTIVIPSALLEPTLIKVIERNRSEDGIRYEIQKGMMLTEALEIYGHL